MKKLIHSTLASIGVAMMLPAVAHASVSAQTLKNLNTAFQGESNAANRYSKFAEKAEAEGFSQVAKLFRAASAAEAIHRNTHEATIVELGGKVATFQLDEVTPGSTAENLQAAIKGETYERDVMYPEFLALAKSDDSRPAIRTLEFAMSAEKEHARLYQDALANLGKNSPANYFVCQVCGMTLTEIPAVKCPSCRKSRDEYKQII